MDISKRHANALDLFCWHLSDKFQRDMNAFHPHPARGAAGVFEPRAKLCQGVTHGLGNIERHEDAHDLNPERRWAVRASSVGRK